MLKVDTGRLREPAAWTMLAAVITTVLVSIAHLLIGSSSSSTFGVRAATSLYSLVSPVSTALAFGAVLLVAKAGTPTPRARLVALGAAGSLGLSVVFGVIAVLGVLVGELASFRDRFEYLITGLPMVALAVFGALFALSTASALQPVREPAGDFFGRREDAYPPQPYAPALPHNPQAPQAPQQPHAPHAPQGAPAHAPGPVQQAPHQQVPNQQQFGHPAPGDHQSQPQGQLQGQPQGPAYGQSAPAPAHPQLPPAEHRYPDQQQYGQEYEPQPSYAPAPTAPQSPPFGGQGGQPGSPAPAPVSSQGPGHGQMQQAQQPRPSLQDVQTGAHYPDYGPYGAQPEAAAPQRADYAPPPQGPVFDQYGYAGQQTDSGGYGQFPSAPPAVPDTPVAPVAPVAPVVPVAPVAPAAPDPRGYGQPSSYAPVSEARPYEQDQSYGQGSPFSGYSGQAFARHAAEQAPAGGPAFDAPPAYEGPADPREQQLAQAYQQAQSYQKGALPDHPTGPQDMPEYYDNPLGHPQSEPAPFQPPVAGPADQTVRFDSSGYHGDPLSDPLPREEPLDPTAIYTPDRSQAKYEEGSAPDQAGRGTDPNLPWYGSER
ncbi:hypothetical protein [Microbispora bryophytorum]|uniref:hypothetical protein n=1 Tax=Microbispora bryophytorum TaxID=1460882 RepID=UPI003407781F